MNEDWDDKVGNSEGFEIGEVVLKFSTLSAGRLLGWDDGWLDRLGREDGCDVGQSETEGCSEGWLLGILDNEGIFEGWLLGSLVIDGASEGIKDGRFDKVGDLDSIGLGILTCMAFDDFVGGIWMTKRNNLVEIKIICKWAKPSKLFVLTMTHTWWKRWRLSWRHLNRKEYLISNSRQHKSVSRSRWRSIRFSLWPLNYSRWDQVLAFQLLGYTNLRRGHNWRYFHACSKFDHSGNHLV